MAFDTDELNETLRLGLYRWLMDYPGEYKVTFTLSNGSADLAKAEASITRWLTWQSKRVRSDLALAGVLTGKGKPHLHGFLWGADGKGTPLTQNPHCTLHKLNFHDQRYCPGFVNIKRLETYGIHSKEHSNRYATFKNWDTSDGWRGSGERLFEPVILSTNDKLISKGGFSHVA